MRTLRSEVCDHVLILNEAHAREVLAEYQRHYNQHRAPPSPRTATTRTSPPAQPCGRNQRPHADTHPRPQWTHQRIPIHRLTCSDDFSSGTGKEMNLLLPCRQPKARHLWLLARRSRMISMIGGHR
ncbi:hypothetical protein [Actinosynnema sp. ALI-1.44]|uniref:hypothetical protein n=1 Tax=Actinosynnema sp. ALI-1.44 TaxID=1933779 RepID=UPI001EDADCA2|nr:hypothetical protein [Actinosynnema sp. ALI-1.44]